MFMSYQERLYIADVAAFESAMVFEQFIDDDDALDLQIGTEGIKDVITGAWNAIVKFFRKIGTAIMAAIKGLREKQLYEDMMKKAVSTYSGYMDQIGNVSRKLNSIASSYIKDVAALSDTSSDNDFHALGQKYSMQATKALASIKRPDRKGGALDDLDAELMEMRENHKMNGDMPAGAGKCLSGDFILNNFNSYMDSAIRTAEMIEKEISSGEGDKASELAAALQQFGQLCSSMLTRINRSFAICAYGKIKEKLN